MSELELEMGGSIEQGAGLDLEAVDGLQTGDVEQFGPGYFATIGRGQMDGQGGGHGPALLDVQAQVFVQPPLPLEPLGDQEIIDGIAIAVVKLGGTLASNKVLNVGQQQRTHPQRFHGSRCGASAF